jgi:hypothetical protein
LPRENNLGQNNLKASNKIILPQARSHQKILRFYAQF